MSIHICHNFLCCRSLESDIGACILLHKLYKMWLKVNYKQFKGVGSCSHLVTWMVYQMVTVRSSPLLKVGVLLYKSIQCKLLKKWFGLFFYLSSEISKLLISVSLQELFYFWPATITSILNLIIDAIRYLKLVRSKPMDLTMKEGVDTLLMRLLLQVEASDEMERFAASKNDCIVVCSLRLYLLIKI